MDVGETLVADGETPVPGQPRQRPLHYPPVPSQSLATLYPDSGYPRLDSPLPQRLPTPPKVIRLVRVQLLWSLPGPAPRSPDWLDSVYELFQQHRVVSIGSTESYRERDAFSIDHNMPLCARFAFIRRIRPGLRAPFLAGMLALSRLALVQSIRPASPSRFRSTRWSRCHTPACCQSRSLLQQVMPDPQPISMGNISHCMPDLSTKIIPPKADLSGTRGLPPLGFGGSFGNRGSIASHSSSLTSCLLIASQVYRLKTGF